MSEVWITKNGFRVTEWDGEIKQNVEKKVKTLLHELRAPCHIEMGVTLEDIFKAVDKDDPLMSFLGEYSWCDIPAFHKESKKPTANPSTLSSLEISRSISIWEREIEQGLDFYGIDEKEVGAFAIELTPVNELKHLPVMLNKLEKVFDNRPESKSFEPIATGEASYRLIEVLGQIYYEISFHGSPELRDEFALDLQQRAKEYREGKLKTVPLDLTEEKPN